MPLFVSPRLVFAFSTFAVIGCLSSIGAGAQKRVYASTHHDGERVLPQTLSGGTARLRTQLTTGHSGLSMVVADFDEDGTKDLVTGYAAAGAGALLLQRGSPVAQAPGPIEWAMQAAGQMVAPYGSRAEVIALPVRPDLLVTGDVNGRGHSDLVAGQKGDSTLYLLRGTGQGSFGAPEALALGGSVSSLTTWRDDEGNVLVVAGVCGGSGCGLEFLGRDGKGKGFVAIGSAVSAMQTGDINSGRLADLAVIAGGRVLVLDGDSALTAAPVLETLPVSGATALALGSFVPDHHLGLQVAALGTDAVLHVLTRAGIDATYDPSARGRQQKAMLAMAQSGIRPAPKPRVKRTGTAWVEAETVRNVGPGGAALMLRARLMGGGNDDLAIMAGGQFITVGHPVERDGTMWKTEPLVQVDSSNATVTAAVAARVSADSRPGIVTLGTGVHPLAFAPPGVNRTMNVNTSSDATPNTTSENACKFGSGVCTLRAAITVANLDRVTDGVSKVDQINIPAGMYTLSAYNVNSGGTTQSVDYLGSVNYHFELDASMNLVGAGTGSTIINGNQIDQVFTIDNGSFYSTREGDFEAAPQDTFLSGMTIENGRNPNNPGGYSGSESSGCTASNGSCNYFGGNIAWVIEGGSNLVFSQVLVTSGTAPFLGGGGIMEFYDASSSGNPGPLEFDNSTISANTATADAGGGIQAYDTATPPAAAQPLTLVSSVVTGNTSASYGGGIYLNSSTGVTITNSIISNNTATGTAGNADGGGLYIEAPLTMTGTTVSGNKALGFGGGLYADGLTFPQSITGSDFLGNTLTAESPNILTYRADGAGVCLAGYSTTPSYTLHYNRFHGNTGTGSASIVHATGLGVGCEDNSDMATVNATDNWWGCNPGTHTTASGAGVVAIAGTNCDTAENGSSTGTLMGSPYTTLTLTLNNANPSGGSSITATGSLGQDSNGTAYTAANDTAYDGLSTVAGATGQTGTAAAEAAVPAVVNITQNSSNTQTDNGTLSNVGSSLAGIVYSQTASQAGSGSATVTVDGCTISQLSPSVASTTVYLCNTGNPSDFMVVAPDLTVTNTHTGNFKAGDTADTYTLTVGNAGNASTSGTVSVTDTLPNGFTATALSGTGWACSLSSVQCTRSDTLAASVTYPAITLTVAVASTDVGTYSNLATVSGGGELNTNNDTTTNSTIVVGTPTVAEVFSPTSVAPNTTSTITFTLGNPSANSVSLTGVAFSNTLPAGLSVKTAAATTCSGGTATGAVNATAVSLNGATIASGATCTVTVGVQSAAMGSYTNTTSTVTATNSNAGGTASATLTVTVTPTRLVYTAVPASTITAGGNAGTISVALEDASGNVATNNSGTTVTLTVTGPGGYSQTYTATTTNGVATYNLSSVSLTVAGTYTYTATSGSLTSAQASETVNPGAAASLQVTGLPTFTAPQMAGTATVKAADAYGNTATSFTGTVTLTSASDPTATFSPASYAYTASDTGSHTFSVTFDTAGTQTVTATAGSATGSQGNIVVDDAIWILNTTDQAVRLTDAGVQTTTAGTAGTSGASPYGAVAFDHAGAVWVTNYDTSAVAKFSATGATIAVTGTSSTAGISSPTSLYVDGLGQVWVTNTGNSSLSVLSNAGAAVSPSTAYQPGTFALPDAIVVDTSGSVWIANRTSSTITKVFGAAGATVAPLVTGTINKTLGTQP